MSQRKQPQMVERLERCRCCGHPITQRHHLLDYAKFEETNLTWQLCANCHEIYHVILAAYEANELWSRSPQTRAGQTWFQVNANCNDVSSRAKVRYLIDLCQLANIAKQEIDDMEQRLYEKAIDTVIDLIKFQGWTIVGPADEFHPFSQADYNYYSALYIDWMKGALEKQGFVVIASDDHLSSCPYCNRPYNGK